MDRVINVALKVSLLLASFGLLLSLMKMLVEHFTPVRYTGGQRWPSSARRSCWRQRSASGTALCRIKQAAQRCRAKAYFSALPSVVGS